MDKGKKKVQMPAGIRAKLMAAVSMLLVSSIMTVSSTYAWFTLSTAPEVTNISTSVAGNGSLEIALMPSNGFLGDIDTGRASVNAGGTVALTDANTTWGNIINLSDASYGLNDVELAPATWNADAFTAGKAMLSVPTFGYDGRIDATVDTVLASYQEAAFNTEAPQYGVRAFGLESVNAFSGYGYIVDFAARINTTAGEAGNAMLQLQTAAAQRIDGSESDQTMGGGSYMEFTVGANIADGGQELMEAIRVTFVANLGNAADGVTEQVLGTARLNYAEKNEADGKVKLPLYLYDEDGAGFITTNADLMEMAKNTPVQISAVVWLDGGELTNAAFAAEAANSLNGVLNLQFTTDVELIPADNSELYETEETLPQLPDEEEESSTPQPTETGDGT